MNLTDLFPADLFKDKTVFVTGGGSGINFGIASAFAQLGANIGLCGRKQERLDTAKAELEKFGVKVHGIATDVRDYIALIETAEEILDTIGPIDVLVCGAAGNFPCLAKDLSANGFKTVVDIDLLGTYNASRAAFEQLSKRQGSIISISAGQAHYAYAAQSHVGAAKAGIENLMKNLALEWGRYGIRCNCIVPGPIKETEGFRRLIPESAFDALRETIPLRRFGRIEDIANTAVFLASPLASYITGASITVDGGQNLPGSGLFSAIVKDEWIKARKQANEEKKK